LLIAGVWGNEAGVGKGRVTSEFAAFPGLISTRIHLCRPRDPEAEGLVERANGYMETSFLPGRHFTGPDEPACPPHFGDPPERPVGGGSGRDARTAAR
jgi:hypothetical protein